MSEPTTTGAGFTNPGDDEEPFQSRLWLWQISLLIVPFLFALQSSRAGQVAVALVMFFTYMMGALSYFGEAERLRKADAEWVPKAWLYAAAYVILTPLVAVPIYIYQRWRHVGLNV